jgi:hypothetical protein
MADDEDGPIMNDTDTWFLLVQHKLAGPTEVTTFDDGDAATTAYNEAERRYENSDVDVLLVGASSLDAVKAGYPSYFINRKSAEQKVLKWLADLPF